MARACMDIRSFASGLAAALAIIAATYLFAIGADEGAERIAGLAGMALTYIVGLHSSVYTEDDAQ